jgi:ribonuclease HI
LIKEEIKTALRNGRFTLTPMKAVKITVSDPAVVKTLQAEKPEILGEHPQWTTATDGSGMGKEGMGAGGLGAILIGPNEVILVLSGRKDTTSGEMEMAAALEAITAIPCKPNQTPTVTLSDYATWTSADLDKVHRDLAKKMKYKNIWRAITCTLHKWAELPDSEGSSLTRMHVNSHKGRAGEWKHTLNELADVLAKMGKKLSTRDEIPIWSRPPEVEEPSLVPARIEAWLTGPISDSEFDEGLDNVSSAAPDSWGQSIYLIKKGGSKLRIAIRKRFNEALYEGRAPHHGDLEQIIGRNMDLAKEGGGG